MWFFDVELDSRPKVINSDRFAIFNYLLTIEKKYPVKSSRSLFFIKTNRQLQKDFIQSNLTVFEI